MSALGGGDGFKPVLLRSSTGVNEKVLKYLEGLSRESADTTPPRSIAGSIKSRRSIRSTSGSKAQMMSPRNNDGQRLHDLAEHSYEDIKKGGDAEGGEDGDVDSDVQEEAQSEHGTAIPEREPGPGDPPGPHYESYDSGPSFGNFGPLPSEAGNGLTFSSWQPPWVQNAAAAQVPLPQSVTSPQGASALLEDMVSSPKSRARQTPSRASQRAPSIVTDVGSARAGDSPGTPPRPQVKKDASPMSPVSAAKSLRSKVTDRATEYPPLPSAVGDTIASPSSKSKLLLSPRSNASSVSPSDSPSQMKPYRPTSKTSSPQSPIKSTHNQSDLNLMRSPSHQHRTFSPYRHAPTSEDLLHAAVRGRALMTPPLQEQHQPVHGSPKTHSQISTAKPNSPSKQSRHDRNATPTQSRPHSPNDLDDDEEEIVKDTLAKSRTPRTSYYAPSTLGPEVVNSHFHDMELCVLMHEENDPGVHELVKKALRKAVRQRVKKLGMKYDHDSITQYRKSFHNHDPSVHLQPDYKPETFDDEPPEWAKALMQGMARMQENISGLGPKIEELKTQSRYSGAGSRFNPSEGQYARTPLTQTVNIHTQPTGTMADSMFQSPETEVIEESERGDEHQGSINEDGYDDRGIRTPSRSGKGHDLYTDGETRGNGPMSEFLDDNRDDSPGQQFLEEELYKLQQKKIQGSQSAVTHRSWEVTREGDRDDSEEDEDGDGDERMPPGSGLPTIPGSNTGGAFTNRHTPSPPLPPLPQDGRQDGATSPQQQLWHPGDYSHEGQSLTPWQRIHQRLLGSTIIWSMRELDMALNSTTRGHQVDEVALSIWSTQTYKRYVRAKLTDSPQGVVDRLFVPPHMADAISNAVFNGRHGEACGMLRDLWSPFGLEGMPRLLVVLAKHRSDDDHWVVHRFSLPDGALTTYDSYPHRTLPDGRPLGWWFAIRVAWPNAIYPDPDHLMQRMVRLHRPMQLPIDNSVAAAGIWRNILMGSRAERSLDLERLRDLINTEVKNLRQRKLMGKLSIGAPRPAWDDMN